LGHRILCVIPGRHLVLVTSGNARRYRQPKGLLQISRDSISQFTVRERHLANEMTGGEDYCSIANAHDWSRRLMLVISMTGKPCPYCKQRFQPSRYRPDQRVCSSLECQRRRRNDYHQKKLSDDPVYRDQCRDSQKKWREKNTSYMQTYRADHRVQEGSNVKRSPLIRELRRLLTLVKNNVALDLRSLDASVWLVCPSGAASVRNNLASAKLIILQGILHVAS
jgi:hypothetical protein